VIRHLPPFAFLLHLGGTPKTDVYEGYNELGATDRILSTVAAATGAKPSTLARLGANAGSSALLASQMRIPSGDAAAGPAPKAQPLSSIRGAGFTSKPMSSKYGNLLSSAFPSSYKFDPLGRNPAGDGPAPPLVQKTQDSPQEQARELEIRVHNLLEQTAVLLTKNNKVLALEKAKEAVKVERALAKHLERYKDELEADQENKDLQFATVFNLAQAYQYAGHFADALEKYNSLIKDRLQPLSFRVRVNMGHIYFVQNKYQNAIKMYRMTLDQLGPAHRTLKLNITKNIGVCQLRLGQFPEAIQTFESVCELEADPQSAFNLLVASYATGEIAKMQRAFGILLAIKDEYINNAEEEEELANPFTSSRFRSTLSLSATTAGGLAGPGDGTGGLRSVAAGAAGNVNVGAAASLLRHGDLTHKEKEMLYKNDELRKELKLRRTKHQNFVSTAARLIAPVIGGDDIYAGYDWVIEELRSPRTMAEALSGALGYAPSSSNLSSVNSGYPEVALEMEVAKGIAYLKHKDIKSAYKVFQSFEARDEGMIQAATNLSVLYFLEGDFANAEAKADAAMRVGRYDSKVLVNKANIHFIRDELEIAREHYLEAVGIESDCTEAIYNLGLCSKRLGLYQDALLAFEKLNKLLPDDVQVVYQIADLYDLLGNGPEAMKWFKILHTAVPNDPRVLGRLGSIACRYESESSAVQYFLDAYHVYPVAIEVISWLGVWYAKQNSYEEAIKYFQRAAEIQPQEIKWRLMVATCYRRMPDKPAAMAIYKSVHAQDPSSLECLKYMTVLAQELGDPDYEHYSRLLSIAERAASMAEMQQQQMQQQAPYAMEQDEHDDGSASYVSADEMRRILERRRDEYAGGLDGQDVDREADPGLAVRGRSIGSSQADSRPQEREFPLSDHAGDVAPLARNAPVNQPDAINHNDDWGDDLDDALLPG